MPVPQVAIVGRPNVGKSSLLNWIAGKRIAIVDRKAGVTRDRVSHLKSVEGRFFELVDTGGIGIRDDDDLTAEVERQVELAIESASVILFVVDAQKGIAPLDQEVAQRLRFTRTPILIVANKADHDKLDAQAQEFRKFGKQKLILVSTLQNRGKNELLAAILERLPPHAAEQAPTATTMKVAIVGRRNTGKSTFVNTLARAERMIVSEIAGTTRDSVDVRFELDGKAFIAIDTPGLRRSKAVTTDIDFYGTHRAQRSIRRADVVLLFFDAGDRISKVDRQLCDYITEHCKPVVFVVNKWDLLADSLPTERWVHYLRETFRTMAYAPIAFITGKTGKNVKALINHAQMLFKQARERVPTGELNRIVKAAVEHHPPPLVRSRRPKILYCTQVGSEPPTIVLFCTDPKAVSHPYQRYLLGVCRDQLPFAEVPIKLYLRERRQTNEGGSSDAADPLDESAPAFDPTADGRMETSLPEPNEPAETSEYFAIDDSDGAVAGDAMPDEAMSDDAMTDDELADAMSDDDDDFDGDDAAMDEAAREEDAPQGGTHDGERPTQQA